jgi:hypothetical protein
MGSRHLSGCGTSPERGDRDRKERQGESASCHAAQPVQGQCQTEDVAELCKEAYNGRKATIKEGLADVPLEPAAAGIGSGSLQGEIRLPHQRGGVHRTLRVAGNAVVAPAHM